MSPSPIALHAEPETAVSGSTAPLFNPRRDFWPDHFQWSDMEFGVLEGKTASGRVTVVELRINDADRATIQQFLATLVLSPEIRKRR